MKKFLAVIQIGKKLNTKFNFKWSDFNIHKKPIFEKSTKRNS